MEFVPNSPLINWLILFALVVLAKGILEHLNGDGS